MGMHVFPKGNDRSWTRGFYYSFNRLFRWYGWKHKAEIERQVLNLALYGTTHPEMFATNAAEETVSPSKEGGL